MKQTHQRLTSLAKRMDEEGLGENVEDLTDVIDLVEEDDEQRPLLDAKKTDVPGTWVSDDETLIKTSKE